MKFQANKNEVPGKQKMKFQVLHVKEIEGIILYILCMI